MALGVAAAVTGLGTVHATAAPAPAPAPAPVKDTTARPIEPVGEVPGAFASWTDLLATQQKLVKAADRITAATKTKEDTGYAGIIAAPENHELRVYWKGDTPRRIDDLIGRLREDVPVSILPAAYSARELEREMNRLARVSAGAITSIAPKVDGSGLSVSGADLGLTRAKVADSTVPITIQAGVTPALASRWDDSPPWWGGAAWRKAGIGGFGCSTGFAVTYGGTTRMLTAAHCGDVGQTATDPTGQAIGPISSYDDMYRDVMLINAGTAGRVYNNNPGTISPEFSNPVIGTTGSYVGMWLCTSGAYSGTLCSIQAKQVNVTLSVGYPIYGLVIAEQAAHTNAAGGGDSGGPVEIPNPSSTTQQYAVGVISAIDPSTPVPCTGYVTSGRTCSWRFYYAPWSNATTAFPGITLVTG
ncbi:hypothetical protein ABZT47_39360 [Sphaerisporangium sp. NPDC005289]|uniref:hypothetical protein n=1 Tax=Sphaerisporangium sp. NPDC005289 TaxID=3155247 RepID=UPI0033AAC113